MSIIKNEIPITQDTVADIHNYDPRSWGAASYQIALDIFFDELLEL